VIGVPGWGTSDIDLHHLAISARCNPPSRLHAANICAHAAGWSSQVARRAHNPEVVGSNPTPAIREAPANTGVSCCQGRDPDDRLAPIGHQSPATANHGCELLSAGSLRKNCEISARASAFTRKQNCRPPKRWVRRTPPTRPRTTRPPDAPKTGRWRDVCLQRIRRDDVAPCGGLISGEGGFSEISARLRTLSIDQMTAKGEQREHVRE
jgi:hypothetical protein